MKHPHAQKVEEAQRAADPFANGLIEAMKGQLLLVFLKRLGGEITLPVAEVDDTGGWILKMSVDQDAATFTFVAERKQ